MNRKEFVDQVAQIADEDPARLSVATLLNSLECWDSLAKVSFVAFCAGNYGVSVNADEVNGALTVADLAALVEKKQAETQGKQ